VLVDIGIARERELITVKIILPFLPELSDKTLGKEYKQVVMWVMQFCDVILGLYFIMTSRIEKLCHIDDPPPLSQKNMHNTILKSLLSPHRTLHFLTFRPLEKSLPTISDITALVHDTSMKSPVCTIWNKIK
jgi:hypothetical protein